MGDLSSFQGRWPRDRRTRRLRVALGVGLVLAFSLWASGLTGFRVARMLGSVPSGNDPVRFTERRFLQVAESLPARGVVGYRARGPLGVGKHDEIEGDSHAIVRYVVARYLLAPRILVLDPARTPVVRDDLDPVRVMGRETR